MNVIKYILLIICLGCMLNVTYKDIKRHQFDVHSLFFLIFSSYLCYQIAFDEVDAEISPMLFVFIIICFIFKNIEVVDKKEDPKTDEDTEAEE